MASVSAEVGKPAGMFRMRFSTCPSSATSTHQRALRLEPHEFDMLEPDIQLGGEHDAGGAREPGQQARGLHQHVLDRLAGGRPPAPRSRACHSRSGRRSASAHRRRSAGPVRSAAGRPRCAAHRSGRAVRGPTSRCGPRPATATSAAAARYCASRPARRSRDSSRRSGGKSRANARSAGRARPGSRRSGCRGTPNARNSLR